MFRYPGLVHLTKSLLQISPVVKLLVYEICNEIFIPFSLSLPTLHPLLLTPSLPGSLS